MFQLIRTDPPADQVRRITFVPFLADGRCVLIEDPGGPALPVGEVRDGEDYLLSTVLRVPLETAGFRYQRFHPFGLDRDHLYAWIEGGPYTGSRPHRSAVLSFVPAEEAADRLRARGELVLAAAVRAAANQAAAAAVGRPHLDRQRCRLAPARRPALRLCTHPARLGAPGAPHRPDPPPPGAYCPARDGSPAGQRLRRRPGHGSPGRRRDAQISRLPLRGPD